MLLLIVSGLLAATGHTAPSPDSCPSILTRAGIDPDNFVPFVTHSIHSLSLEDIRFYFKSDAQEENNIPTVNPDMDSEERVLPHAPLAGYDDDFSTPAMRQFDMVMRNMDRADWQVKGYSPLEMTTHVFHMAELWNQAAKQYDLAAKLLDPHSHVCGCMKDVENNGIMQYMNLLAFKIRYPGITSGNATLTAPYLSERQKRSSPNSLAYKFSVVIEFLKPVWPRLGEFDFSGSDVELLRDVAEQLVDGSGVMTTRIDSEEHWESWREMVKSAMRQDLYYDLGVFMFCMLN